jgi:surfeit locus 1 family protein
MLSTFSLLFSRRWWWTTLLVLLAVGVMVRLGFWQLDRLEQRRAFNDHLAAMQTLEPIHLPSDEDLTLMEFRVAIASGYYDFPRQVALRNRYWRSEHGYHLLTPLVFADGSAVLVDRGWIPAEGNQTPADWRKYDQSGLITVQGIIRLSDEKTSFGGVPDPQPDPGLEGLDFWNTVNLTRIKEQVPYRMLPIFIQPDDPGRTNPPIPFLPELEISEGPHLGYAGQWFTYAALLALGYPFFVRKQERPEVER